MKKVFSIVFSLILLLSGMHFSIATHFCGDEISEWKISSSETKASCGMCHEEENHSSPTLQAPGCCSDALSVWKVDSNFQQTQIKLPVNILFTIELYSVHDTNKLLYTANTVQTHALVRPPGILPEAVNLADICVFRI